MKIFILFALIFYVHNTHAQSKVDVKPFQAVVVGADQSHVSTEEDLSYALTDAERVEKAMRIAGRVPHGSIYRLNNPTVAELKAKVRALAKSSSKKFMFYFSGHSSESGLHLKNGTIYKNDLHEMLESINADVKVVILDSCYSGSLKTKGVRKGKAIDLVNFDVDEPTGSVILTSSSGQEQSYESEKLKGSIFTYHLVTGLYGEADGNRDGLVTIDELYQYVYAQTKFMNIVTGQRAQNPEFQSKLVGKGALVVSYPIKSNGRLTLNKNLYGDLTLASANGVTFFKLYKNKGEDKTLSIPSGNYKLSMATEDQLGQAQLELLANEKVSIESRDLQWGTRPKDYGKEKGIIPTDGKPKNQFLFGVEAGTHRGFHKDVGSASTFDITIYSPSIDFWSLRWRLSAGGGSLGYELESGDKEQFDKTRFGFEGNFNGPKGWNSEWTFGLQTGSLRPVEDNNVHTESMRVNRLYFGKRFYPKNLPFKWGLRLGVESFGKDEQDSSLKEKNSASTFSLFMSF